jgi:phage tail-like protein
MDMWKWRALVEQGKIAEARKNGSIVMFDTTGKEIARWNLVNAWPSKLTGPTANATNNEVGIEELEIVHEGYTRIA